MTPPATDHPAHARRLCERGAWPELLAFAGQWQQHSPADPIALYYLGLGHAGLGQFPQAETAYRRALALDSRNPKIWNNLALVLYEHMGQPEEGIRCIRQALHLDPANKTGWANLATMLGRLGDLPQAIECADRAIALDPNHVEAHLHKAAAARALGREDILHETCLALARIAPEDFRRTR